MALSETSRQQNRNMSIQPLLGNEWSITGPFFPRSIRKNGSGPSRLARSPTRAFHYYDRWGAQNNQSTNSRINWIIDLIILNDIIVDDCNLDVLIGLLLFEFENAISFDLFKRRRLVSTLLSAPQSWIDTLAAGRSPNRMFYICSSRCVTIYENKITKNISYEPGKILKTTTLGGRGFLRPLGLLFRLRWLSRSPLNKSVVRKRACGVENIWKIWLSL